MDKSPTRGDLRIRSKLLGRGVQPDSLDNQSIASRSVEWTLVSPSVRRPAGNGVIGVNASNRGSPLECWSGRPDSNRRRPAWEAGILPLNYSRSAIQLYLSPPSRSLSHVRSYPKMPATGDSDSDDVTCATPLPQSAEFAHALPQSADPLLQACARCHPAARTAS